MNGFFFELRHAFTRDNNSLYKLLAVNIAVFAVVLVAQVILKLSGLGELYESIMKQLAIPSNLSLLATRPWTIITYMFLHEGFFHVLFNMLFLYWFGRLLFDFIGSKHVFSLYVLGGIAGAIAYVAIYNISPYFSEGTVANSTMLGASAGVFAIVVGAATFMPNFTFHLLLLGPVKIKYIAIFYVILSFANTVSANAGGEIAHLGGALLGFLYIIQLRRGNDWSKSVMWVKRLFKRNPKIKVSYRRSQSNNKTQNTDPTQVTQEEIDAILDKIAEKGYSNLSKSEKEKLFNASKK